MVQLWCGAVQLMMGGREEKLPPSPAPGQQSASSALQWLWPLCAAPVCWGRPGPACSQASWFCLVVQYLPLRVGDWVFAVVVVGKGQCLLGSWLPPEPHCVAPAGFCPPAGLGLAWPQTAQLCKGGRMSPVDQLKSCKQAWVVLVSKCLFWEGGREGERDLQKVGSCKARDLHGPLTGLVHPGCCLAW